METKTCIECGLSKPLDDYHRDRTKADGHLNICKPCKLAMKARWQKVNWSRLKDYHSEWDRTKRKSAPLRLIPALHAGLARSGMVAVCPADRLQKRSLKRC